jgi:hypothetical protein
VLLAETPRRLELSAHVGIQDGLVQHTIQIVIDDLVNEATDGTARFVLGLQELKIGGVLAWLAAQCESSLALCAV